MSATRTTIISVTLLAAAVLLPVALNALTSDEWRGVSLGVAFLIGVLAGTGIALVILAHIAAREERRNRPATVTAISDAIDRASEELPAP